MGTAEAQWHANESVLPDDRDNINALGAAERRVLRAELEAALGFADYCRFIGQKQVSSCAKEFVSLALRLYAETLSAGHVGPTAAALPEHPRIERD